MSSSHRSSKKCGTPRRHSTLKQNRWYQCLALWPEPNLMQWLHDMSPFKSPVSCNVRILFASNCTRNRAPVLWHTYCLKLQQSQKTNHVHSYHFVIFVTTFIQPSPEFLTFGLFPRFALSLVTCKCVATVNGKGGN